MTEGKGQTHLLKSELCVEWPRKDLIFEDWMFQFEEPELMRTVMDDCIKGFLLKYTGFTIRCILLSL